MKKFIVVLGSKQRGMLDDDLLQSHVEHLRRLHADGHLVLCGPFEDDNGALQILAAHDVNEALALVERDPFVAQQYYRTFEIRTLIEANEENDWLMDHPMTERNTIDTGTA